MKTMNIIKRKDSLKRTVKFLGVASFMFSSLFFVSCVDNDDDVPENYYKSTKVSATGFLQQHQDKFGNFITILKRTPYYSMLDTYGNYTLFAPEDSAVNNFLASEGFASIEAMSDEDCAKMARTHIIKNRAVFTTDVAEGQLGLNMNDAAVTLSSDSMLLGEKKLTYYINKNSRMIEFNDSVNNGVVHILDHTIAQTDSLLAATIGQDSTLQLFYMALKETGMDQLISDYKDESYSCGVDSTEKGYMVRCTSGSQDYTRSFWVGKRYFKYTAFVEPDSIYHKYGIQTLDQLKAYAKKIYDQTYPEDAGLYDDDPTNRKNPLNRFISYHLLPRYGDYNAWVQSGELREHCWVTTLTDPEEFYETMCPGTIMRFAAPPAGLFINRKGVRNNAKVRGVRVLSESESGKSNQNALNGVYYYIDDILAYTPEVRDVVLNCRIRIDATTLSPDFMNCNGRGRYGEDILTGFKNGYITNWKVSDETYVGVHSDVGYWNSYCANAVCISGVFDVSIKLPPVPSGTYEVRLGYTCGEERGVVQVYMNNVACGIPVDLRVYGADPTIGWIDDKEFADEDEIKANDKAMHNRGFMKGPDSYHPYDGENTMRATMWNLRRVLTTQYLTPEKDYWLRFRQVLDDPNRYWSFDYIELCPKSIYGSPEGEDTH